MSLIDLIQFISELRINQKLSWIAGIALFNQTDSLIAAAGWLLIELNSLNLISGNQIQFINSIPTTTS